MPVVYLMKGKKKLIENFKTIYSKEKWKEKNDCKRMLW